MKCQGCGLLQLSPIPSIKEDKEFYDENRQSKNIGEPRNLTTIKQNSLADSKRRMEMVRLYLKKNDTILDIGSGYGFFLEEMRNCGYNVTGIEISKERRQISSRITSAKVLNVDLNEKEISLPKFDCITLFHVLEHIREPILFLKIIKKYLAKNGKLIIEVPNADDILLDASKKYKDFYWQRAHLAYFATGTLKQVVRKAGFSVIDTFYIQRYGIENFMNWLISGKPQLKSPEFQTKSVYKWLEDYYKKYLCKMGKSDTLIVIIKPK